jgi:hypothetical protein
MLPSIPPQFGLSTADAQTASVWSLCRPLLALLLRRKVGLRAFAAHSH